EAREAGGLVGHGAGGGEGPALGARAAELGPAHHRLAGVDAHVQRDGLDGRPVLLVEIERLLADREGRARGVHGMILATRSALSWSARWKITMSPSPAVSF